MAEIRVIDKPKAGRTNLASVPEEVKSDIEETFAALGPKQAAFVEFGSKKELNRWVKQARTYCENRTDAEGNPAPIEFRRSPASGLTETQIQFLLKEPKAD